MQSETDTTLSAKCLNPAGSSPNKNGFLLGDCTIIYRYLKSISQKSDIQNRTKMGFKKKHGLFKKIKTHFIPLCLYFFYIHLERSQVHIPMDSRTSFSTWEAHRNVASVGVPQSNTSNSNFWWPPMRPTMVRWKGFSRPPVFWKKAICFRKTIRERSFCSMWVF